MKDFFYCYGTKQAANHVLKSVPAADATLPNSGTAQHCCCQALQQQNRSVAKGCECGYHVSFRQMHSAMRWSDFTLVVGV
jgi:hypothetical protein